MAWPKLLLDFLFPPCCLLCSKTNFSFLCPTCQKRLPFLSRQICPDCLSPLLSGQVHENCKKSFSLDGLISTFSYKPHFKEIIAKVKFEPYLFSGLEDLTNYALALLVKNDQTLSLRTFIKENQPVVIPIPLHRDKYRLRGFNQAEIIARLVADYFNLPLETKLLLRTKKTAPQLKLDRAGRKQNVRGAFEIDDLRFKNCSEDLPPVLLVDDIWTTGATMKEAVKILKKAGIPHIWGLTLAGVG